MPKLTSYRSSQNAETQTDISNGFAMFLPDGGVLDSHPDILSLPRNYQVISRPARFFKIGRVFKTLWTEPAGNISEHDRLYVTSSVFGESSYTKIRHFVVVGEMQFCSLCLPLITYNRQGASKSGIKNENYAMVYAEDSRTRPVPEDGIIKESFPIVVEDPNETIDPKSRIDFGRVYTVEHNIKVAKVGRIHPDFIILLSKYLMQTLSKGIEALPVLEVDDRKYGQPERESATSVATSTRKETIKPSIPSPAVSSTESPVPKGSNIVKNESRRGASSPDSHSRLDNTYKVRNTDYKKFFRQGRVFNTLWTDTLGANDTNDGWESNVSTIRFGEKVLSRIRCFVVVRQGDRSCSCLPITTYSGRGAGKRGIRLVEHGLVYSDPFPEPVNGIDKDPLRVVLSRGGDRIPNPALINYGKVYNMETNVKVKDVGELDTSSRKLMRRYFNDIQMMKDEDSDHGPRQTSEVKVAATNPAHSSSKRSTPVNGPTKQPIYGTYDSRAYAATGTSSTPVNGTYASRAYATTGTSSTPVYDTTNQPTYGSHDSRGRSETGTIAVPVYDTTSLSRCDPRTGSYDSTNPSATGQISGYYQGSPPSAASYQSGPSLYQTNDAKYSSTSGSFTSGPTDANQYSVRVNPAQSYETAQMPVPSGYTVPRAQTTSTYYPYDGSPHVFQPTSYTQAPASLVTNQETEIPSDIWYQDTKTGEMYQDEIDSRTGEQYRVFRRNMTNYPPEPIPFRPAPAVYPPLAFATGQVTTNYAPVPTPYGPVARTEPSPYGSSASSTTINEFTGHNSTVSSSRPIVAPISRLNRRQSRYEVTEASNSEVTNTNNNTLASSSNQRVARRQSTSDLVASSSTQRVGRRDSSANLVASSSNQRVSRRDSSANLVASSSIGRSDRERSYHRESGRGNAHTTVTSSGRGQSSQKVTSTGDGYVPNSTRTLNANVSWASTRENLARLQNNGYPTEDPYPSTTEQADVGCSTRASGYYPSKNGPIAEEDEWTKIE